MRGYPEYLQLWPGHGAGSACGKNLGAVPSTTLGYERLFNWAFAIDDEEEFVRAVLAGQPEPPRYFARMKMINRDGPPPTNAHSVIRHVDAEEIEALLGGGAATVQVVDARPAAEFAAGFLPGTINIPAGKSFATWAGALLSYDRDVVLLVDAGGEARATALERELMLIGLDRVTAWGGREVFDDWRRSGKTLAHMPTIDAKSLSDRTTARVIDVRGDAEWAEGRIPGAMHLFLGDLVETATTLQRDLPIVVACQGGTRSSIGASLLHARGFTNVSNFPGGFAEWKRLGFPVETSDTPVGTG
jgi:hydroxyacylglutathione hydrolase